MTNHTKLTARAVLGRFRRILEWVAAVIVIIYVLVLEALAKLRGEAKVVRVNGAACEFCHGEGYVYFDIPDGRRCSVCDGYGVTINE